MSTGVVNEALEIEESQSPHPYIINNGKMSPEKKLKDNEFEELPHTPSVVFEKFEAIWANGKVLLQQHQSILKTLTYSLFGILYNSYLIGAIVFHVQNNSDVSELRSTLKLSRRVFFIRRKIPNPPERLTTFAPKH